MAENNPRKDRPARAKGFKRPDSERTPRWEPPVPLSDDQGRRHSDDTHRSDLRSANRSDRGRSPEIDEDITGKELAHPILKSLESLGERSAEWTAKHLIMADRLLDEDPELAFEHTLAASRRAGRLALVREAVGIAAYRAGKYHDALRELRTHRRISGQDTHLPLIADAERGLGRPEKALEIARSADAKNLDTPSFVEMSMVESGARADLGQDQAALHALETKFLRKDKAFEFSPRLFRAYSEALTRLGRDEEAAQWEQLAVRAEEALGHGDFAEPEIIDLVPELGDEDAAQPETPDSDRLIWGEYDGLLCDLDGVIYEGPHAIDGAIVTINTLVQRGLSIAYITNNAARSPETVAAHLSELGIPTQPEQIFGAAAAGADMVAKAVSPGARILVAGSDYLRQLLRDRGFTVLTKEEAAERTPDAVIQGFDPELSWADLAQASYAINDGATWFATNEDLSIPQPQGIAPGNGAMVNAVAEATGTMPTSAGKPEPYMFTWAAETLGMKNPLVVGDRLDTDILGGNRAGIDTVLVLTGIDSAQRAARKSKKMRPIFTIETLKDLLHSSAPPEN